MLDFNVHALYLELNALYFQGILPPCQIRWSRRLTRCAGTIRVQTREIALSIPLLVEAFADGKSHEVCGLKCENFETALHEILKHEMIHLWLFEKGEPHGHTPAFRRKAREIGQSKTRHGIALPLPTRGWIYSCASCESTVVRQKRFRRIVACAACCRAHNGGKFGAKWKLIGRKIG